MGAEVRIRSTAVRSPTTTARLPDVIQLGLIAMLPFLKEDKNTIHYKKIAWRI